MDVHCLEQNKMVRRDLLKSLRRKGRTLINLRATKHCQRCSEDFKDYLKEDIENLEEFDCVNGRDVKPRTTISLT